MTDMFLHYLESIPQTNAYLSKAEDGAQQILYFLLFRVTFSQNYSAKMFKETH